MQDGDHDGDGDEDEDENQNNSVSEVDAPQVRDDDHLLD